MILVNTMLVHVLAALSVSRSLAHLSSRARARSLTYTLSPTHPLAPPLFLTPHPHTHHDHTHCRSSGPQRVFRQAQCLHQAFLKTSRVHTFIIIII